MQPRSNIDGISKLSLGPVSGQTIAGKPVALGSDKPSPEKAKAKPHTSKNRRSETVTLTVLVTILVMLLLVGLAYYAYTKNK